MIYHYSKESENYVDYRPTNINNNFTAKLMKFTQIDINFKLIFFFSRSNVLLHVWLYYYWYFDIVLEWLAFHVLFKKKNTFFLFIRERCVWTQYCWLYSTYSLKHFVTMKHLMNNLARLMKGTFTSISRISIHSRHQQY
jgi:hypothetical protein